jgi:hypothetical protein
MDHGPVLSRTYNLLKREDFESPLWDQYIVQEGPQDHRLFADPGVGKLSRYEIEKLKAVSEKRRPMNDYDIAVESHGFDEWIKNKPAPGSSRRIPIDDVLAALDLTPFKEKMLTEARADDELDQLLASTTQK